jgi:tRNA (cmo5U34)-methyltransferase
MSAPAELRDLIEDAQRHLISTDEIRARFDEIASPDYGGSMARWIPEHDYAQQLLVDALRLHLPARARVLDLGAGTGRVSRLVLEAFEDCHVTLVDFSEAMLKEAPGKLAAHAGRFGVQLGDFFDPGLALPTGAFDTVVSVFAVCHGRGVADYQRLYQRISRWLKPGGLFLCCDHVLGDSAAFTLLNVAGWRAYMEREQSRESAQAGIRSTYDEDSPLPLRQHLDLLREAGFETVDILWKRDIFALYAGVLPAHNPLGSDHG